MTTKIEKALTLNIRKALQRALVEYLRGEDDYGYVVDFDEDSSTLFYEVWDDGVYETYKIGYEFTDASKFSAKLIGDKVKVVYQDSYVEVKDEEDSMIQKMFNLIEKHFGGSQKEVKNVIKQFDDVKHTTVEFLYVAPNEVDGVGDTYLEEDLQPMINSFNKAIEDGRLQSGLFHKHKTDKFKVVKAWAAEEDCTMGEFEIKKGQPLVEIEYLSEELYELRKSGDVMGPSIGARAVDIIEIDDNGVEKSLGESEIIIGKSNPLNQLKTKPKAKRILKGINFDWDNPELTLTDPSAGGACSLKNEIIIEKSMSKLNKTQEEILEKIGEEFTPIAKALEVDNPVETEEGKEMSIEKDKEIAELRKQLRKVEVEKSLGTYELDAEVKAELVEFMSDLEDATVIVKALDAMVASAQVKIEKAKESVESKEENPIAKALSEEKGYVTEPEIEVEKSIQDKTIEILKSKGAK